MPREIASPRKNRCALVLDDPEKAFFDLPRDFLWFGTYFDFMGFMEDVTGRESLRKVAFDLRVQPESGFYGALVAELNMTYAQRGSTCLELE
jgi:hypothetical protein